MIKILILILTISFTFNIHAAESNKEPMPKHEWSFNGITGTFDRAALQRGFKVYREVCAGCHSMKLLYYRDLLDIGFSEEEVKSIAAEYTVLDGPNDEGEMFDRPGLPSDHFPLPYPNENAARVANNGALPPDLSLTTKAHSTGVDYIAAVLTGYVDAPAGFNLGDGMYYNTYYSGNQIAMPSPLAEDAVEFADGTKATVKQMALDVSTFLAWAAEPEMEERKRLGIKVMIFLIVLTALLFALKRKIWADIH